MCHVNRSITDGNLLINRKKDIPCDKQQWHHLVDTFGTKTN